MIRILIVDDDALIRDFFMTYGPRELNAIFSVARSANEAIRLFSEGKSFDVIVTDYSMNDGNGADLLCYLHDNNIKVISALYTSIPKPQLRSTNAGFLGIFDKTEFTLLISKIRNALDQRHSDALACGWRRR
jgi:CheY-like chemotaxis protein